MRAQILAACILLLWSGLIFGEENANTYTNNIVGISITKPADWHFATTEQHQENLARVNLKDEEFQQYIMRHASLPIVSMIKYPDPHDDVNPSLKITVRPLGTLPNDDPVRILELIVPAIAGAFDDSSIEEKPCETVLAGARAAYTRIHYSLGTQGSEVYPICSELWVITRVDHLIMIGSGIRQDERNGTREEIREILATLQLDEVNQVDEADQVDTADQVGEPEEE